MLIFATNLFFDLYNFGFPGHEESYNPSLEYIPTEEEKAAYELMYEEDRPKFIPKRYAVLTLNVLLLYSSLWYLLA